MKALLGLFILLLLHTTARAQYWRAIGLGTVGPSSVQTLYGDSVSDRLLAGGTFLHILNESDTVLAFGQAAWNGTRWDSLATRIQNFSGGELVDQTFWFLRFQGELYACGGFALRQSNGEWTNNLARLDEQTQHWEGLGCNVPSTSGIRTLVPKKPSNTLYATGYPGYDDEFCGFPQSNVFRYDGAAFHPWEPFSQIPLSPDNYVGYIFDFQGMTYMTGTVRDPLGPGFATFLRYNGTAWEHVPGWDTQSPIKGILIHNDTLYVAGAFRYATGGPGDLIANFDGENWNDMGGGLAYAPNPYAGAVLDLEWWHGKLLVSGFFSLAGGIPCSSIANWNGHQWCTFPGMIHWQNNGQATISDMAIWRDSLYICGGINTIDGDTIRQVAQWIGGDAVAECSTPTEISELPSGRSALTVVPLPDPGEWTVRFPHPAHWSLAVHDALGRAVGTAHSQDLTYTLDLHGHAPGLYLLRATTSNGEVRVAKVINGE